MISVFVIVWGGKYSEELIQNLTGFVVRLWGVQYSEEVILNVTVFMNVWVL